LYVKQRCYTFIIWIYIQNYVLYLVKVWSIFHLPYLLVNRSWKTSLLLLDVWLMAYLLELLPLGYCFSLRFNIRIGVMFMPSEFVTFLCLVLFVCGKVVNVYSKFSLHSESMTKYYCHLVSQFNFKCQKCVVSIIVTSFCYVLIKYYCL